MKRLVRATSLFAALFLIAVLLAAFSSITEEDAAAKLRFVDPSGQIAQALPAMAFVVSDDGTYIHGPLCNLPEDVQFRPIERKIVFTNILGKYIPFLIEIAHDFGIGGGEINGSADPGATLEWNAEILQPAVVTLDNLMGEMLSADPRCDEEFRRALGGGQCVLRVATVYRLTSTHDVLAVQFQQECVSGADQQKPRLAPSLRPRSFFTRVKMWIGLIDMRYASLPEALEGSLS